MTEPWLLAVGETMALVTPAQPVRLMDAVDFHVDAGGAESNVASHAAALGVPTAWFSRLGDDALGHRIAQQLADRQVDVSRVVYDAARPTGLYVKDPGHGVRYYRAGSAASALSAADADGLSLDGVRVVHVSGIAAALSPSAAAFLDALIDLTRAAGAVVSFDVNHR